MKILFTILAWLGWGYLAFILVTLARRLSGEEANKVYKEEDFWDYMIWGPIGLFFTIISLICHLPWKNAGIAIVETIVAIKNKKSEDE